MAFAHLILLGLTGWLGWTAAINMPFMPDGMVMAEGLFWPAAIVIATGAFGIAALADKRRGTSWLAVAALALGILTGGLGLRLLLLPLLKTASPLTLIGLREILGIFAALYLGFAWMVWRQRTQ